MRTCNDERLRDRQTDTLAGPSDDGSFARQMQIHVRPFIRLRARRYSELRPVTLIPKIVAARRQNSCRDGFGMHRVRT